MIHCSFWRSHVLFMQWLTVMSPLAFDRCHWLRRVLTSPSWSHLSPHSDVSTPVWLDDVTGSFLSSWVTRCPLPGFSGDWVCVRDGFRYLRQSPSLLTDLLCLTRYRPELYICVCVSVSECLCVELYIATVIQEEALDASDHIWTVCLLQADCTHWLQTVTLHTLTSPSSSRSVCKLCVVVPLDHHYQAM